MIEPVIALKELIVELLKLQSDRQKGVFDEFYRPIFEDLISIHHNYCASVLILQECLKTKPDKETLLKRIETLRVELLPARQQVQAVQKAFYKEGIRIRLSPSH
jgi:hypothetical protein